MTPRMSQRARAREIYGELAVSETPRSVAITPLPNPPPHSSPDGERPLAYGGREQKEGEGEQTEQVARAESSLTSRVRALYENSAVPVREIARLAGVTERTIYKYVAKGGWTKRYARVSKGPDSVADVAPVKGAGGRFIRREDKGKPFARGLKSTDPAGRGRALAACRKASRLSRAAQAKAAQEARDAQARRRSEARLRAIAATGRAFADLNAFRRKHAASLRRFDTLLARQEAAKAAAAAAAASGGEPSKHVVAAPPPASDLRSLAQLARLDALHVTAAETALRLWRALPE